jgi:hypothetical protein
MKASETKIKCRMLIVWLASWGRAHRWLLCGLAGTLVFCALGLGSFLRLWRVTEEGFTPVVRISLVDWMQAFSLARQARESIENGDVDKASRAWRLAIANHPGEPLYLREYISGLLNFSPSVERGQDSLAYGDWLLRLTETNRLDQALVSQTLEHNRQYSKVLLLNQNQEDQLLPKAKVALLRSLFFEERYETFLRVWRGASAGLRADPTLQIFGLGVTAMVERGPASERAFIRAFRAYDQSQLNYSDVMRVGLRVFSDLHLIEPATAIYNILAKQGRATLPGQLDYWAMLIREGNSALVASEWKNGAEPLTEEEALNMIQVLRGADLMEAASAVCTKFLGQFYYSSVLWVNRGDILILSEDWQKLKSVANNLRSNHRLAVLWAVAYYWEGIAEWQLGNIEAARRLWGEIADAPEISSDLGAEVALGLAKIGEMRAADEVIEILDPSLHVVRQYWLERCRQAIDGRDLEQLVDVSFRAYEAEPDFIPHINNYVVALLLSRDSPELALVLSKQLYGSDPTAIPFQLTYAHALIQNDGLEEAERLLGEIDQSDLDGVMLAADFLLAQFELAVARNHRERVFSLRRDMTLSLYLPEVAAWIESAVTDSGQGLAKN